MNLRPDWVIEKFLTHPIGSQEHLGENAEVIVKYFNPFGAGTWLITEAEQEPDGSWLLFGYCHITEWEWGYVSLEQLEHLKLWLKDAYTHIEIDEYCRGKTVKEAVG